MIISKFIGYLFLMLGGYALKVWHKEMSENKDFFSIRSQHAFLGGLYLISTGILLVLEYVVFFK